VDKVVCKAVIVIDKQQHQNFFLNFAFWASPDRMGRAIHVQGSDPSSRGEGKERAVN
jgi:hypothetical protein